MKNNTSPERKAVVYLPPRHLLVLHTLRTQTRQGKEYDGEYFCHQQVAEKPRRPLEIQQYLIDHSDVDTHYPRMRGNRTSRRG